jgi:hypothetical protein
MLHIKIINDGTGDVRVGNYDYEVLINNEVIAKGRIEAHDRADQWPSLIRKLLQNAYKGV